MNYYIVISCKETIKNNTLTCNSKLIVYVIIILFFIIYVHVFSFLASRQKRTG